MRRLGIDPGTARTGLAVADDEVGVATPHGTVQHHSLVRAASEVAKVIESEEIGEAVVGLPLSLDGREGEAARRARAFARELQKRTLVPVVLWDERLSTVSAERALRTQGVRGAAKRSVVDQAAATVLLQSYMDRQRASTWQSENPDNAHDPTTLMSAGATTSQPRSSRKRRADRDPHDRDAHHDPDDHDG
jgi:putative Holliday junction resolvase